MRLAKFFTVRWFILWLCLLPALAYAKTIDFKDFKITGKPQSYKVATRIEFELTDYLRNALLNGITLNAHIQFRLGKHKSWWFNDDTALVTIPYQLKYHALSRHYLLSRHDTNEHWNFSNLPSALRKLSEPRQYSLPDITPLVKTEINTGSFYILAVADLVPSTLNIPLRFQSLFSDEYTLKSEGVVWPLP